MRSKAKPPTQAEGARIAAAKMCCCIPCLIWYRAGNMEREQVATIGDYNHTKSGNKRRGHRHGFMGCLWHHRGRVEDGWSHKTMRAIYGPSLMDGSRLFHETYGTDDELIAIQNDVLEHGW